MLYDTKEINGLLKSGLCYGNSIRQAGRAAGGVTANSEQWTLRYNAK